MKYGNMYVRSNKKGEKTENMLQATQRVAYLLPALFNALFNPLPNEIEEQDKFRVWHHNLLSLQLTSSYAEENGKGSKITVLREIENQLTKTLTPLPNDPLVKVMWTKFEGIPVLVHEPTTPSKGLWPGILFLHGGAYVYKTPESYVNQMVFMAKSLNAVIISVNYSRAPEYTYPTQINEIEKVYLHWIKYGGRHNVDVNRIAIMGDSVGGGLASALSIKLRDSGLPVPKVQVLIYPALQAFDFKLPSSLQNDLIPNVHTEDPPYYTLLYLGVNASYTPILMKNQHICENLRNSIYASFVDVKNLPEKYLKNYEKPYKNIKCNKEVAKVMKKYLLNSQIFPLMEKNLKGLPPTLLIAGTHDVLRDDGILYSHRLKSAGIPVEEHVLSGGFHGMFDVYGLLKIGDKVINLAIKFLKKNL